MKLTHLLAIVALVFAGLAAKADSKTYQGVYKMTSFDGSAAKLTVNFLKDQTVTLTLSAPSAACTLTFAKSKPARDLAGTRLYDLPVIESCFSPGSFRYALVIETAADGKRTMSIRGTNGKMTWVYFRAL